MLYGCVCGGAHDKKHALLSSDEKGERKLCLGRLLEDFSMMGESDSSHKYLESCVMTTMMIDKPPMR